MTPSSRRDFDRMVEGPGLAMFLLVVLVTLVMLIFGAAGAFLLDDALHDRGGWPAPRPGIELMVVPLTAIGAARWRWGADRIIALRSRRIDPYLPLLMAVALVGLIAYLVWSWDTSLTRVGPDEFGLVRWLGTALTAAFTVVWLPLFSRVTATLVGMIAGPTLFGLFGYTFFGSQMQIHYAGSDGPGMAALFFTMVATPAWTLGAILMSHWTRRGEVKQRGAGPLIHGAWSGVVMLSLAILGVTFEHFY